MTDISLHGFFINSCTFSFKFLIFRFSTDTVGTGSEHNVWHELKLLLWRFDVSCLVMWCHLDLMVLHEAGLWSRALPLSLRWRNSQVTRKPQSPEPGNYHLTPATRKWRHETDKTKGSSAQNRGSWVWPVWIGWWWGRWSGWIQLPSVLWVRPCQSSCGCRVSILDHPTVPLPPETPPEPESAGSTPQEK